MDVLGRFARQQRRKALGELIKKAVGYVFE